MTNLLQETLYELKKQNLTVDDICFVSDGKVSCDWDTFACDVKDYNYDSGFGDNEVNMYLKVVGADWWLERYEYDGSEWWEFKKLPVAPSMIGHVWYRNEWELLWGENAN